MENKKIKPTRQFGGGWPFDVDPVNAWASWEGLFTPEECKQIIEYANFFDKEKGMVGEKEGVNLTIRDSEIIWISPNSNINWLYQKLTSAITILNTDYFKFDLFGITEPLQFTEYKAPTGYYGKHIDSAYDTRIRKLSISVQLTDPRKYEGGDLQIYLTDKPHTMKKEQGTMICFPSWSMHEVMPVTKGIRHSLVGWISGKPFK